MYQAGRGVRAPPCCGCMQLQPAVQVCGISKAGVNIMCSTLAVYLIYRSGAMLKVERKLGFHPYMHEDNPWTESMAVEGLVFCSLYLVLEITGIVLSFLHVSSSAIKKPPLDSLMIISWAMTLLALFSIVLNTIASFYCRRFGFYMLASSLVSGILSCYTSWITHRYIQSQKGVIVNDFEGRVGYGHGGGPGRLYE